MATVISKLLATLSLNSAQFQKGMTNAQTSTKTLGTSMKALGGIIGVTFGVAVISNFVKAAVKAYDIQLKAEAALLQALKGRESQQQALIYQAILLQRTTLYGDESTIQSQAMLATLGLTARQIRVLIPLVQDFATAFSVDVVTAANLIGKSVGSSTNALSRYGIQIEGAAKSAERLASAQRALQESVGGQAAVAATAGTGNLTQLANAWGDFQENLIISANSVGLLGTAVSALTDAIYLLGDVVLIVGGLGPGGIDIDAAAKYGAKKAMHKLGIDPIIYDPQDTTKLIELLDKYEAIRDSIKYDTTGRESKLAGQFSEEDFKILEEYNRVLDSIADLGIKIGGQNFGWSWDHKVADSVNFEKLKFFFDVKEKWTKIPIITEEDERALIRLNSRLEAIKNTLNDLRKAAIDPEKIVERSSATAVSKIPSRNIPAGFGKMKPGYEGASKWLKEYTDSLLSTELAYRKVSLAVQDSMLFQAFKTPRPFGAAPTADELREWRRELLLAERGVLSLSAAIGSTMAQSLTVLADAWAQSTILGDENAWASALQSLGGIVQQFGALLIAWGVGWYAFKVAAAQPWVAIAAGAVLIAAGAGIKALGQKSQSAPYSSGSYSAGSSFGGGGYDYDREVVLVARGQDLVAVLNRTNNYNGDNGP